MGFYRDYDDIPSAVLEEMAAERRRRARRSHWCEECHGHTQPGSPCHVPDEDDATAEGDDEVEA